METHHNTNPTPQVRGQDRLILSLAGIVIALICSLVFLHDNHLMGRTATRLGLDKNSKIVPSELSIDIKKFRVASATSLFR
jgi:hypothetical protein